MKVNLLVCISFEVHRIFSRRTYENSQMMRKKHCRKSNLRGKFLWCAYYCNKLLSCVNHHFSMADKTFVHIQWDNKLATKHIFHNFFFPHASIFAWIQFGPEICVWAKSHQTQWFFLFVFFFFLAINELLTANTFISVSAFSLQAKICAANILHENRLGKQLLIYKINKSSSCQPSNPVRLFDILLHMMWKLKLYRHTLQNPHDMLRKKNHPTRNRRVWYRKIRFMFALFHIHIFQNNNTNMKKNSSCYTTHIDV